jgi:hypothetical protein
MSSLRAALAELDPFVMDLPELPTAEMPPAPAYSFPQRYRDLMGALASLEVLRDARPLVSGSLRQGASDDLVFTEADSLAAASSPMPSRRRSSALWHPTARTEAWPSWSAWPGWPPSELAGARSAGSSSISFLPSPRQSPGVGWR